MHLYEGQGPIIMFDSFGREVNGGDTMISLFSPSTPMKEKGNFLASMIIFKVIQCRRLSTMYYKKKKFKKRKNLFEHTTLFIGSKP